MATGLSPATAASIVNAIVDGGTYEGPPNLYAKLHTGDPGLNGTSNAATETTRKLITFSSLFVPNNPNTNTVTWPAVAGVGTINFKALTFWDALTSGNVVFSAPFNGTVVAGADFEIVPGGFLVNLLPVMA